MAMDMQAIVREILTNALQGGGQSSNGPTDSGRSNGAFSGMKGVAIGAGTAALAPVALKGIGRLAKEVGLDGLQDAVKSPGEALGGAASSLGDRLTSSVKDQVEGKIDEAGGPGGMLKEVAKSALPFGSEGEGSEGGESKGGVPGTGKGRRMPVQQSVDIALPLETVYNQWTQFEEWPNFMHRVTRVTQEDECTVSFAVKIWGKTKEFTAKIETQRPDDRIKWRVSQGMTHTGIVSFRELAPNLTRVELGFDVDPGGLIEKLARGARHVKRAARGDFHRFKAFIEMAEQETGAWRGVIEDGELVDEHDPSYDDKRQYSDIEELTGNQDSEEDEDQSGAARGGKSGNSSRASSGQRSRKTSRRRDQHEARGRAAQTSRRRPSNSSRQTRGRSAGSSQGKSGGRSTSSRSSKSGSSRASSSKRSSGRGRTRSQGSKG